jgi:hypothetical protein
MVPSACRRPSTKALSVNPVNLVNLVFLSALLERFRRRRPRSTTPFGRTRWVCSRRPHYYSRRLDRLGGKRIALAACDS